MVSVSVFTTNIHSEILIYADSHVCIVFIVPKAGGRMTVFSSQSVPRGSGGSIAAFGDYTFLSLPLSPLVKTGITGNRV